MNKNRGEIAKVLYKYYALPLLINNFTSFVAFSLISTKMKASSWALNTTAHWTSLMEISTITEKISTSLWWFISEFYFIFLFRYVCQSTHQKCGIESEIPTNLKWIKNDWFGGSARGEDWYRFCAAEMDTSRGDQSLLLLLCARQVQTGYIWRDRLDIFPICYKYIVWENLFPAQCGKQLLAIFLQAK